MDEAKSSLLQSIRAARFSMLECALFLDTHPHNTKALEKFEAFRRRANELTKQYEDKYGPLTLTGDFGNGGFDWINDPWPWEKEAN